MAARIPKDTNTFLKTIRFLRGESWVKNKKNITESKINSGIKYNKLVILFMALIPY
jgi:hypothetical protein